MNEFAQQSFERQYYEIIARLCREEGLELWDLELSISHSNLKVFIHRQSVAPKPNALSSLPKENVTIEDCVKISRAIDRELRLEGMPLAAYNVEVSSPGINRKLQRKEHFQSAVGERIKVVARAGNEGTFKGGAVTGKLLSMEGDDLMVEDEQSRQVARISLDRVKEARIDFAFK